MHFGEKVANGNKQFASRIRFPETAKDSEGIPELHLVQIVDVSGNT
jgi:hypothetical protein